MKLITEPFTLRGAARHGLDTYALTELCRAGELIRPHQGVYIPVDLADNLDARIAATALVLPRGAAVARESAAWILGLDVRPPERWRAPPLLECLVPLGAVRPDRPGINAFISDLPPEDIAMVSGLPVTTPTRTGMDLARYRPRFIGLGSVDALTHAGLTTIDELAAAAERLNGRRFIRRARDVIDLCEPAAESPPESWCRLRLIEAGLPRPVVQISLTDEHGREVYRLDMGILKERVGIEYDGREHHLRTVAQERHDERRRRDIHDRFRWTALATTSRDILGREPLLEHAVMELLGISLEVRRRRWEHE
ncbi:type IV toxin-antitoxin system AbiEi family antitoxin [Georgenia satyanarayanai]|uniref:type IV toxin-antitoxin system AbiEi family antitoxin domain-containing protein n=1 Tax=Georgenia satyanarayanai TaxID=860221 RepID=UPI00203F9312|nr:type IV toxin-antitoxin system AbiEi family antitoxin [Georgenia satyanarayanai]MCM3661893.1 type IV toxin-antitoxin system AbiEi family antitoxin [Georgenia satyanarayanai]